MRIKWTQNAISDLAAIYEFIATDSPRYAVFVVDRLTKRTMQLSDFPLSGQMVPEYQRKDVREIIEYSYRVLYHVGPSSVSIIALIHAAHPLPDSPPFNDG
jgi:addiction module RelE/StbE family toxin